MRLVQADTNVLTVYMQPDHLRYASLVAALGRIRARGDRMVIASQNLAEFWAVATRPTGSPNGLGYTPAQTKVEVDEILRVFDRLPDLDAAFPIWRDLVERYGVSGKTTHDARLVATMLANGVDRLLTFNGKDFARFAEIGVEAP